MRKKTGLLVLAAVLLTGATTFFTSDQVKYLAPFTGAVSRLLTTYLSLNISCKDFGCVGNWDGATGADDTAAFQAAIAAVQSAPFTRTLHIPAGRYKVSTALTSTGINIIGEGGADFNGVAATELDCFGAGACWTFNSGTLNGCRFEGIKLLSKAAGQTGLIVQASFGTIRNVGIREFDTGGLQMGVAGSVGAYYSDVVDVAVFNPTVQGTIGVLVSGGFPSTNANHFRNIVVSGRFTHMVEINGTKNIFWDGDVDPDTRGTGVASVWYITGSVNEIRGSYSELTAGSGPPANIVTFTNNTNSNTVANLQVQYAISTTLPNQSIAYVDQGWNNRVDVRAVGFNFLNVATNSSDQNVMANSGFQQWDVSGAGQPLGCVNFAGTFAQDAVTTHGTSMSLKMTGAGTNPNLSCYFVSPTAGDKSLNQYPIAYFRGKQVTCSAWAKSSFATQGNIRVNSDGSASGVITGGAVGQTQHSGSGNWELLTATNMIPVDATKVGIAFRNTNSGGTLTGDVWFSEPTCVVGSYGGHYAPHPLYDTTAQLMGPIIQSPPATLTYGVTVATDASLSNSFTLTVTNGVAFTMSNPTNLKTGQRVLYTMKNTSGGVMGAVTWGATFKTATFTAPATAFNRSVEFQYNGTNLVQLYQSAADVPN